MLSAAKFLDAAQRHGYDFFTGVPCSFLTPLINRVISDARMTGVVERPLVYAGLPYGNAEGFYERAEPLVASGRLAGVLDIHKPEFGTERDWRRFYCRSHRAIASTAQSSTGSLCHPSMMKQRSTLTQSTGL